METLSFSFAFHFCGLFVALAHSVPIGSAVIALSLEGALATFALGALATLSAFAGSLTQPGEEFVLGVGLFLFRGRLL